jgi:iron complex outermembrane receptor protein
MSGEFIRRCSGVIAALLPIVAQVGAHAQATIEEIVVTAEKRAESAQDVPIAIDVVNGDDLVREGVRDVKELAKMSTELEINYGAGQALMVGMRGMQQQGFAQTGEPLTTVHIDGAYLASFWGLNGLMFDIDRVEVLAGPQGTLYGRNATAGAINLITKRPGRDFAVDSNIEFGSDNLTRIGAGVSLPMGDKFSMRLAGQKYERDALFNDGSAAQDQSGARVSGVWTPSDVNEVYFTIDSIAFDGTNGPAPLLGVNANARLHNGITPASVTNALNSPTLQDPYNILPYYQLRGLEFDGDLWQDHDGAMIQYTHDFGAYTAILEYSHRSFQNVSRAAAKPLALWTGGFLFAIDQEFDTADFRLVSDSEGAWEWQAGLFYYDSTSEGWAMLPGALDTPSGPVGILTGQPSPIDTFTGLTIGCPCIVGFWPNSGDAESYAAYGQTTWTPEENQRLHVTLGLRYSHDWKNAKLGYWSGSIPIFAFGINDFTPEARQLFATLGMTTDSAATASSTGTNERDWDKVQYRIGLEYEPSDNVLVYGSLATGYKAGAFTYGITPELQPEDLTALEFGVKSTLKDGTLQLNASLWFYDYKDLEVGLSRVLNPPVFNPFTGGVESTANSTANVGKAELRGIGMDLNWLATQKDQFGLSFTHLDSKVKDGTEEGNPVPLFHVGARVGDAPEWNAIARYSRTFDFANGARLVPQLKYQWQSEKYDEGIYLTPPWYPDRRQYKQMTIPSRGVVDFSLTFSPANDRWDASAYVHNATDELLINSLTYDAAYQQPSPGTYVAGATFGHLTGQIADPRTYGVLFNVRF